MLSRTPIASIISITLDGTLVTATDYKLEDREIGFVFDDSGWGSELVDVPAIARSRSSQPGDLVWAVRYRGGYYLPSFSKLTGVVSGATQANPVVITATAHALATGDRVELAAIVGMTELNRRRFTITVIDANSYSLDSEDGTTHTSYSSGGTWASTPQLPGDLEQIVIDLIRTRRAMKARDPSIKSERLGDWSVTYEMGASGLPLSIEKRLLAYQSMSP